MIPSLRVSKETVAGGRLASSAQPPRATSRFTHRHSTRRAPQPFPRAFFLDTPDALREGLRCFTAFRPLLLRTDISFSENNRRNP
jgi:hypothetical protein